MCGIAGIVDFAAAESPRAIVEGMCGALRHRGPDDGGVVCVPSDAGLNRPLAVLGSRRLSIIDVAGGHQPVGNEDGSVWTILNGEIYNFADLRQQLEASGHRFRSASDTEVVAHAYEQWGDGFVERLDGMFALAIWDAARERLVLARDRFGKKPLVYFDEPTRFVFASELRALMDVPGAPRDLDLTALGEYLAYMAIPAPATIYARVKKLPPAHVLTRDHRGVCIRRYWSLHFLPKQSVSFESAVERVRELLMAAVRKRLVGEVPLGAFLSGGLDSSAVVALMTAATNRPVKTFSIGFDRADYDELPYARQVASALGSEHQEFVVHPSAIEVLPQLVEHFGEPFADSSAVPSWYLARLTRQSVTVALNGDGGDELFAGYGRHRANVLAERWARTPSTLRHSAGRVARVGWLEPLGGGRATRFVNAAELSRADRFRAWAGVFGADLAAQLSTVAPASDQAVPHEFETAADLDAVDAMLAVDTRFYLPTDLLPKVDITSMAHSLEVRSPLLDVPLAEFVAALPSDYKLQGLTTKRVFKAAMSGRLPAPIVKRKKRGFAVPIASWLRGELREYLRDHLQPSRVAQAGLLEARTIDRLIADHLAGHADHAHQLWTLLMLELWYRRFIAA